MAARGSSRRRSVPPTPDRVIPDVPLRIRSAFRTDALFEILLGLILMGNPILGPSFPVNSYIISVLGISLLVLAVFLGGAGLGKGPLAQRLPVVAAVNAGSACMLAIWALAGSLGGGARWFLMAVAAGLVVLVGQQVRAMRQPTPANLRPPSTHAQRQAALRGEHDTK